MSRSSPLFLLQNQRILLPAAGRRLHFRLPDRQRNRPLRKRSARRSLLALSVILDIGLLVYFKYTNFFIEIINGLSGRHWLDFQNIFLPVGISFSSSNPSAIPPISIAAVSNPSGNGSTISFTCHSSPSWWPDRSCVLAILSRKFTKTHCA